MGLKKVIKALVKLANSSQFKLLSKDSQEEFLTLIEEYKQKDIKNW